MSKLIAKVGIISCSGEELAEGTIARQAVRRVLESLRPQQTVTLCLPLFLAGEEGERRFAREHPTITVDGCSKLCAKRGTEKFSGPVSASLMVGDIVGERAKTCHRSTRHAGEADQQAVMLVADRIAAEVDLLVGPAIDGEQEFAPTSGACCACGSAPPASDLMVRGKSVRINGLPLIFEHLQKKGVNPNAECGDALMQVVRIYHSIADDEEADYRSALVPAYQRHCQQELQD